MHTCVNLDQFRRDGYVILDVLSPEELSTLRRAADVLMAQERFAKDCRFHYVPLVTPVNFNATLVTALDHPVLIQAVETMLGGGPLLMDNCTLLAADPGVEYKQGWHRDVLQVPVEFVTDELFSPRWRHNNVQLNMALADDSAFWAVPGSHQRPNTDAEWQAFGGSKHMSPPEASMPGAVCVALRPGQAALYNNNLIHRGHCHFTTPRRTLHIGYHSMRHPPTWHFYSFNDPDFPEGHVASMPAQARKWMEARLTRWRAFPDVKASYTAGFARP